MNIFDGIKDSEMDVVRFLGQTMTRQPGELIFSAGDPASSMFVIESGKVEYFNRTEAGEKSLLVLGQGELVEQQAQLVTGHAEIVG